MAGTWCLAEEISLQLLLLCCTSPEGTVTAVDERTYYEILSEKASAKMPKHS